MRSLFEIDEEIRQIVDSMTQVKANKLGLDNRIGTLWYNEDYIVCSKHILGALKYYGGFEYIEDCFVQTYGEYTFFSAEHSRVQDSIDWIHDHD